MSENHFRFQQKKNVFPTIIETKNKKIIKLSSLFVCITNYEMKRIKNDDRAKNELRSTKPVDQAFFVYQMEKYNKNNSQHN